MEPTEAYDRLRVAIPRRPELRQDTANSSGPYAGACYVATQVFCHLVPEAKPYASAGRSHFWAQIGDEIWDATADQFPFDFDYSIGEKTKFKGLSKRSASLLDTALSVCYSDS